MKIQIGREDLLWSYAGALAALVGNAAVLPVVLYTLDSVSLGLWSVFQSLGSMAALFDFGFSPAFARNIAYCYSGATALRQTGADAVQTQITDHPLLQQVFFTCRRTYQVLACAALVLCLTVGVAYISLLDAPAPETASAAWLVYSAGIFLRLLNGHHASLLRGLGAVAALQRATTLSRVAQAVLTVALLLTGWGLFALGIGYVVYGALYWLLARRSVLLHPDAGRQLVSGAHGFRFVQAVGILQTIWYNAWRDGMVGLANAVSAQAGVVLCSLYLGLEKTAVYSLAMRLTSAVAIVASAVYTAYQPALQAAFLHRDTARIKRNLSLIVVCFVLLFTAGIAGLAVCMQPVLYWLQSSVQLSLSVLLLAGLYQFVLHLRNCYASYLSCTNRLEYMPAFVLSAAVGLLGSVLLGQWRLDAVWVLLVPPIAAQLAYNIWRWPRQVHAELALGGRELWQLGLREIRALLYRERT